jgi:hypothetical protein
MVGTVGTAPIAATVGDTLTMGTAAAELTPRFPSSVDPNGIPVRAVPPGVVGIVDVGADDEAMLLEPEPHIPDNPGVSSIPELVEIPDDVDIPDVAAVAVPIVVPPPSKVEVDPNIPTGAVPTVEHVVPLLGIEIPPVAPVGVGLTPGDAISVEPRGMPVGETAESVPKPSGEVALTVGVGLAIPLTCAMATLQMTSAGMTVATNKNRLAATLVQRAPMSISFATIPFGARLVDIGQSSVKRRIKRPNSQPWRLLDLLVSARPILVTSHCAPKS